MFIRLKKIQGKRRKYLVENSRDGGKVKQKVLAYVDNWSIADTKRFINICEAYNESLGIAENTELPANERRKASANSAKLLERRERFKKLAGEKYDLRRVDPGTRVLRPQTPHERNPFSEIACVAADLAALILHLERKQPMGNWRPDEIQDLIVALEPMIIKYREAKLCLAK